MKAITDPRTQRTYYPGMSDREHKLFLELRTYVEERAAELGEPTRFDSGAILVPVSPPLKTTGAAFYISEDRVSCPTYELYHDSLNELLAAIDQTKETQ